MDARIEELTKGLAKNSGASDEALDKLAACARIRLPQQYREFMRISNGAEGFVGENAYLILWPVEVLLEPDELVKEYAPWLFRFGSNGGDAGYFLDTRLEPMTFVEAPYLDLGLGLVYPLGVTFRAFLENLASR